MKRVLLSGSILVAIAAFMFFATGAKNSSSGQKSFKIEFDNAFGLVTGADFKVAGVPAGSITGISLDQKTLNAVVTVSVTTPGLASFHQDATCNSQPQSLIGEYFVSCDPGNSGPLLKNGATIPVSHTQSTIPADLLLDIMQVPERERLPLIINSLGAGVAARSGDLQAALERAVPALTETDNLLNLLADDSSTIQSLTASSNTVVTALARNSGAVQRFIVDANRAAGDTAAQYTNFKSTLHDLPGFLAQLKPAMQKLGQATDANTPVLENLHGAAAELDRLFTDLPGFSGAARPALKALGKASVTGKAAVIAARPTISELNKFATNTPDLAKNLSIVLPWLDTQSHATETNPRSPGGKGYSGLEALLQFAFNLAAATNYYGPYGHLLGVDGFVSAMCTPYATPATVAMMLKQYGSSYRSCYSFLGPNQPGVNETDPSDPSACVPDPGGAPPGEKGPSTSACTLSASRASSTRKASRSGSASGSSPKISSTSGGSGGGSSGGSSSGGSAGQALNSLGNTVTQVLSLLGGKTSSSGSGATASVPSTGGSSGSSSGGGSSQTQQLLNYLLSP